MQKALLFISASIYLSLASCAPDPGQPYTTGRPGPAAQEAAPKVHDPVPLDVPSFQIEGAWKPEQVELICGLNSCPSQVGVLMFAEAVDATHFNLHRCTATLIASDQIITSGHCDFLSKAPGYFITRSDGGAHQAVALQSVLYKSFTSSLDPLHSENTSGRPDLAIFQLKNHVRGIEPLHLASQSSSQIFAKLISYVVNVQPGKNDVQLQIDRVECNVHRHERYYPYGLNERPDIIYGFGCHGVKGNSGSPVFGDGRPEIEAVLEGFNDRDKNALEIRKKFNREPMPFESHEFAELTNVRCLDYPLKNSLPCVQVTEKESARRFDLKDQAVFEKLKERQPPENVTIQFAALPFALAASDGLNREYEVDYNPVCHKSEVQQVPFPADHVRIVIDAWGAPHAQVIGHQVSTALVTAQSKDTVTLSIQWMPLFGSFQDPSKPLSRQYGTAFSIALPPCSR